MAELRSVDPRALKPNPNNPRRTPVAQSIEDQLIASIRAIGLIQPPIVQEVDGELVVKAGDRRVRASIAAELPVIDVLVRGDDEINAPMTSLSENVVRASMNSVDIWRAVENLEGQGWTEPAIADALALPIRTVKRLKLLAHIHPPILDFMAKGDMPSEDQLRTIATATIAEQAQVWKKHKPKKGEDVSWHQVAHALSKRRIPFSAARFDDDLARAYGIEWHDDLFAPASEDGRYTTNVEGFFGAQQEWLANHLPQRGVLLTLGEYGQPVLPKKAERLWGKPTKSDHIGCYLDPHSGDVREVVYRLPSEQKPAKGGKKAGDAGSPEASLAKARPDVTQRGCAMIGDLRTDALHEALRDAELGDQILIGLLVLALAGRNVTVQSGTDRGHWDRQAIGERLTEGGVLTSDATLIRDAAREMLVTILSCRENMSNSGVVARIAGEAVGAAARLPSMATEEFLSCLSRQALERAASAEGLRVEARVKDTRARLVEHFKGATYHYPEAVFALREAEIRKLARETELHAQADTNEDDEPDLADSAQGPADAETADDPEFADAAD